MSQFVNAVKIVFLLVAWAFWLVFGTLFWLALMARALAVFSYAFMYSMFTRQVLPPIQRELNELASYLFLGYRAAYDALFNPSSPGKPLEVHNARLALEIAWATVFWIAALSAFSANTLPTFAHVGTELGRTVGSTVRIAVDEAAAATAGWLPLMVTGALILGMLLGYALGRRLGRIRSAGL